MTPQQLGYWFEDKVRDALVAIQEKVPSMFHRFVDSKAARNTVAAQPGDHMMLIESKAVLIEEKASTKHKSMRSCMTMLKNGQVAFHRKWHRSGNPSIVAFYSQVNDSVELWNGKLVIYHRVAGQRMASSDKPMAVCKLKDLEQTLLDVCRRVK